MDIKNGNVGWLSNYEVMIHLQKIKDRKMSQKGQLATITYEALKYLETSACSLQKPESITKCLKALEPYNLNKTEKLMLVNNPPVTPLEIQLIVEESEERLSDTQVQEILNIVRIHVAPPVADDETSEMDENEKDARH